MEKGGDRLCYSASDTASVIPHTLAKESPVKSEYRARWVFLPYCIQRLADGRYIVLNRRYKPLGSFTSEWVTYENDPSACAMTITPEIAKRLSWNGSEDTDVIHLYADGCLPEDSAEHLRAYAERLSVFMTLKASAD